jgi:hypothetical protein
VEIRGSGGTESGCARRGRGLWFRGQPPHRAPHPQQQLWWPVTPVLPPAAGRAAGATAPNGGRPGLPGRQQLGPPPPPPPSPAMSEREGTAGGRGGLTQPPNPNSALPGGGGFIDAEDLTPGFPLLGSGRRKQTELGEAQGMAHKGVASG